LDLTPGALDNANDPVRLYLRELKASGNRPSHICAQCVGNGLSIAFTSSGRFECRID
jgi:hypothetical protein